MSAPPGGGWPQRAALVLTALFVVAADVVAVYPASRAFSITGALAAASVAAALSVIVVFAAVEVGGWPALRSYALSSVALVVLLLSYAGPHPAAIVAAIAHTPNRLVTETLPLGGGRVGATGLVFAAWVGGAATSELLLRSPRARGGAPYAFGLPVVLYLACYAAGSSAPGVRPDSGVALLVVLTAAVMAWRVAGERPVADGGGRDAFAPRRHRPIVVGLTGTVAAGLGLAALAPSVPWLDRAPLQLQRRPPVVAPVVTDPVGSMAALRVADPAAAPTPELSLTTSGDSDGYLAMAYLDAYDGSQWRFTARFEPTGARVPAAATSPPVPARGPEVEQRVTIYRRLPIPLLPALDRPTAVSGGTLLADQATGMLLPAGKHPLASYRVTSSISAETLAGLSPADGPASGADYTPDTAIPPDTARQLAAAIRSLDRETGQQPSATVGFLQALVDAFHRYSKQIEPVAGPSAGSASTATTLAGAGSPSTTATPSTTVAAPAKDVGTSLSEVIDAITVNSSATPEQFATLFAMIARYLGVPTRVVAGFRLVGSSSGAPLPAGTYQVTDREAWTWDEVAVAGLGWVVVDPTPDSTTTALRQPPTAETASSTTLPPRQANALPHSADEGHALAPRRAGGGAVGSATPWVVPFLLALAAIAILAFAGPGQAALRRAARRRRRHSEDPAEATVGAWLELLDGMARMGLRSRPGATAREIAADVGRHFGTEHQASATLVADLADRAVFGPSVPPTKADADQAWAAETQLQREVLAGLDRRQRWLAAVVVGDAVGVSRRRW